MVSDRGALNVGDEVTVPDVEAVEWIRLGRAERVASEPELATVGGGETAAFRHGKRR